MSEVKSSDDEEDMNANMQKPGHFQTWSLKVFQATCLSDSKFGKGSNSSLVKQCLLYCNKLQISASDESMKKCH